MDTDRHFNRGAGYSNLARNSVVHHQFDLRIAEFFRRDDCVEGLISDIQQFAKNSTLRLEGHVKK